MIELELHGKNIATLNDDGDIRIIDEGVFNLGIVTKDNREVKNNTVTNDTVIYGVDISNIEG